MKVTLSHWDIGKNFLVSTLIPISASVSHLQSQQYGGVGGAGGGGVMSMVNWPGQQQP